MMNKNSHFDELFLPSPSSCRKIENENFYQSFYNKTLKLGQRTSVWYLSGLGEIFEVVSIDPIIVMSTNDLKKYFILKKDGNPSLVRDWNSITSNQFIFLTTRDEITKLMLKIGYEIE